MLLPFLIPNVLVLEVSYGSLEVVFESYIKLIARVPNRKFPKQCYMKSLVDITATGFQRKFKILTSSSPSGNVASLRSLLGNLCITFPFTSSKIQ